MRTLSRWWRRYPLSVVGGMVVAVLILVALAAPLLSSYDPTDIPKLSASIILQAPSRSHPMGTDDQGRDVFARVLYGARVSLWVGVVAVGISILIGTILGAVAGYFGGWADSIIMRFVDIMLTIPTFFLILAVVAFVGPSIFNVMVIIGLTSWMGVCRLVRAEVLSLREREFSLAAVALGASRARVIFRHILPNALAPVFVAAVLGVAGAILTESGLSYLGLGVQPPDPSWGNILMVGRQYIETAWWLSVFPGLAILITVLSFNLLGEGLRDALDPRLRR